MAGLNGALNGEKRRVKQHAFIERVKQVQGEGNRIVTQQTYVN